MCDDVAGMHYLLPGLAGAATAMMPGAIISLRLARVAMSTHDA